MLDKNFVILEWDQLDETNQILLQLATEYRLRAHAPYSHFMVGAALITDTGEKFGGCNVEDIAYTGTMHAETVALGTMIATLGPKKLISAIAIVLGKKRVNIKLPPARTGRDITFKAQLLGTPCGHCRTMLSQHGSILGMQVIALQPNGQILLTDIATLYPAGFGF